MTPKTRQSGFSLLEVLFAVMVLTLGLIFVACQFPVGLSLSRDITDTTLNNLNTHNADVSLDLNLSSLASTYFGNVAGSFINTDGNVHFLYQPNLRLDNWDMVMDSAGQDNYFNYPNGGIVPPSTAPTYSHSVNPILPNYFSLPSNTPYYLSQCNLGLVVSPSADYSDADVFKLLPTNYLSLTVPNRETALDNAVLDVVQKKRIYSWSALYQCIDPPAAKSFRFLIFTFRANQTNIRYPAQDVSLTNWDFLPQPCAPVQDRQFPVPWFVSLQDPVNPNDLTYFPVGAPWDRFVLDVYTFSPASTGYILDVLRAGSIIVDYHSGIIYTILEITQLTNNKWQIRLNRDLEDDLSKLLQNFWVFPPALTEHRNLSNYTYADTQPVLKVTEKIIRF